MKAKKMRKYIVEWETDGAKVDLPKEIFLPAHFTIDEIVDLLSDEYGWLVLSIIPS